ncbi:hypothetical protein PCH_Pc12g12180 [Penicillium rubens Wisconsin 54-1255]|uniref:Uncharacterized protein n=1 Tax=Penicillium rubens (strain ATCC 28089 / DSM 1075 / NRRL 1951 / Wisconsin 54-1255) TaxID=500485 RepID=B6GYC3_PENRW|nr:hypothetical protein PCH_Pc12g12180 [Penicillium rubens Wisconsin 54-1255]
MAILESLIIGKLQDRSNRPHSTRDSKTTESGTNTYIEVLGRPPNRTSYPSHRLVFPRSQNYKRTPKYERAIRTTGCKPCFFSFTGIATAGHRRQRDGTAQPEWENGKRAALGILAGAAPAIARITRYEKRQVLEREPRKRLKKRSTAALPDERIKHVQPWCRHCGDLTGKLGTMDVAKTKVKRSAVPIFSFVSGRTWSTSPHSTNHGNATASLGARYEEEWLSMDSGSVPRRQPWVLDYVNLGTRLSAFLMLSVKVTNPRP